MATAPVLDPIDSRSTGQDAATLRFQRLERVRARQRARRRHRLIIATLLVTAVAVSGVLGFTAVRGTSPARAGHLARPATVDMPRPATGTRDDRATAVTPAPSAPLPAPLVQRNATPARRVQPAALPPTRGATSVSDRADETGPVPSPAERTDADPADATAVIDWLIKAPRGY
jgi:hypothetical protein